VLVSSRMANQGEREGAVDGRSAPVVVIGGMGQTRPWPRLCHEPCIGPRAASARTPRFPREVYALEWTRTTTGREAHKALNLIRPCHMRPSASRSSVLCGSADASDVSDEMTCAKDVPRPSCAKSRRAGVTRPNAAQGCTPNICLAPCALGRTR